MERVPLVTVIVPAFNASAYIEETLNSILCQTHGNCETIVIDDGSTDTTVDIVSTYGQKIRLVKQDNKGAAAARNRGAHEARGEWLAFLDADDLWAPSKLEKQLSSLGSRGWCYTDTEFIGGANNGLRDSHFTTKYQGNVLEQLVQGNFISTSTVLIKRDIFEATGGFDESLRSIQDWEFWTRVAEQHPIAYVDEPLTRYRVHPSSTSRKTRKTLPNHLRVIDIIFSRVGATPEIRKLKPRAKATSCGICSYIAEEEGDASFALLCAFHACRFQPFSSARWIRLLKATLKWPMIRFRAARSPLG